VLFFSHRTPPIISLGTCISAYIPFLNRWWANWDKLDSQFLPLIFSTLSFSICLSFPHFLSLLFFLFISSLLCLSQILNCSGKNSEHLLLAASKWASLCYQKQLLAFCSWLCCFVLASLQQVHLITISFSSFFPCLCLEKLKFLLVLCFLFEGLFSFP